MKPVFADSFYYIALLSATDNAHDRAVSIANQISKIVTTVWVLTEVANVMSAPGNRTLFTRLLDALKRNPEVRIIAPDQELFDQGVKLYRSRRDKAWSLTDCTSFIVMQRERITEALTGDHHFEQAGFKALLK